MFMLMFILRLCGIACNEAAKWKDIGHAGLADRCPPSQKMQTWLNKARLRLQCPLTSGQRGAHFVFAVLDICVVRMAIFAMQLVQGLGAWGLRGFRVRFKDLVAPILLCRPKLVPT